MLLMIISYDDDDIFQADQVTWKTFILQSMLIFCLKKSFALDFTAYFIPSPFGKDVFSPWPLLIFVEQP